MKKTEFASLELPRKGVAPSPNRYRVYKDHKEFSVVEAKSALEALQTSGLKSAHRIERDSIFANNLVDLKQLEANAPKTEAAKPAEPKPAAEVKPGETDKNLTGDQVDKLLKSEQPKAAS